MRPSTFAACEAGDRRTAIAEAIRTENVYRTGTKDRAASDVEEVFAAFIREIVDAGPALPIGSAKHGGSRRASARPDA